MKNSVAFVVLFAPIFLFSCSRFEEPAHSQWSDDFTRPVLDGHQDPARYTRVIEPDIYIVLGQRLFGQDDQSALVEVRSGNLTKTLVVPAAVGLKPGDVIRLYLICYRAEEVVDAGGALKAARNACTDNILVVSRRK